jgi:N-acetylglucosaminyldiphosphoundecaprenol N-acetyl-beta-D-mannosaminyltransferase
VEFVERFAALTETQAAAWVIERWAAGEGGWVSTPNTQRLNLITRDPALRALTETAALTVADGMPLVWAAALQGTPLPERVAGSSLVWSLARAARDRGASLFLLGGDEGVAERAAQRLRAELGGIEIAGCHRPPFGFERDERELALIHGRLTEANPDIVYDGLGALKEERLIVDLCRAFPRMWFLGIGISLSFISGDQARAPRWLQRAGLEWLHRLSREPTRLFRRYVVEGVPFTVRLLLAAAARRRRRR